ncbi:MAG: polyribonucleotide nucleotidyltransferase [Planctomycetes bacterium]|nr:polyribonucleotide nucleotidyltransferase [Planctomycetota bacterium]
MLIAKTEILINGKTLSIETGRLAKQANGATVVRYGDTVVFAAVSCSDILEEGGDFFPLTVDYREKTSAAGKFPGGFIKREGRPTTKEILTARLIDRPLRPLFPENLGKEISIQSLVLSADQQNDPDVLTMISASAAIMVSDIPFNGPIGSVRMGLIDGQYIPFPTHADLQTSSLDLVVSGTREAVVMVEGNAKELPEEVVIKAIVKAHEIIKQIIEIQEALARQAGKPKFEAPPLEDHSELERRIRDQYAARIREAIQVRGKLARKKATEEIYNEALELFSPIPEPPNLPAPDAPSQSLVKSILEKVLQAVERDLIISTSTRADGRRLEEIRPISIEVGVLPRTHGSAIFTRGETQAFVVVTLGTGEDEQIVDGLLEEYSEKFMVHYNFPSFCVGETWPNRGPKRREIGHGALACRSLLAVVPPPDKFPYTIRVVSDIMESNGSSSMATVCGGTMALMDAGVQIIRPVAGVAMGLIKEGDQVRILTDIQGSEDHNGDMDFKVAGTQRGITGLQMDIKICGISEEVFHKALEQAREGRMHVLREMIKVLGRPRPDISPLAPKIIRMKIDPEKIGIVIGPGGKMIKKIQDETSSTIEIEDDGTVTIWCPNLDSARVAQERIEALTDDVKPGRVYQGRVVSVKDFGCFVEVLPGQEGLVHVSELAGGYVQKVSDVVQVGDTITVKCIGIDAQGRIKLSKKAAEKETGGKGA